MHAARAGVDQEGGEQFQHGMLDNLIDYLGQAVSRGDKLKLNRASGCILNSAPLAGTELNPYPDFTPLARQHKMNSAFSMMV